jgi:phage shock protein E
MLNSISVPLDTINEKIVDKIEDKNKKIVIYCRNGRRSKLAAEKLANLGYKNISLRRRN